MQILEEVKKVLSSKMKGDKWCEQALPILVDISKEVKRIEDVKFETFEPIQRIIDQAEEDNKDALATIAELDSDKNKLVAEGAKIRERVLIEHEGKESILEEGIGELVFAAGSWEIEVTDLKKVDPKYLMVDRKAVEKDAKDGVVNFKGISVSRGRSLRVLTKI